jgi:hypothetical protein
MADGRRRRGVAVEPPGPRLSGPQFDDVYCGPFFKNVAEALPA